MYWDMQMRKDLACWVKLMLMTQHKSRYIVWNTTVPHIAQQSVQLVLTGLCLINALVQNLYSNMAI